MSSHVGGNRSSSRNLCNTRRSCKLHIKGLTCYQVKKSSFLDILGQQMLYLVTAIISFVKLTHLIRSWLPTTSLWIIGALLSQIYLFVSRFPFLSLKWNNCGSKYNYFLFLCVCVCVPCRSGPASEQCWIVEVGPNICAGIIRWGCRSMASKAFSPTNNVKCEAVRLQQSEIQRMQWKWNRG